MKKIFDIFRIRREERWLALVVLVALLALNALVLCKYYDLFTPITRWYWPLFIHNFHISGFDPITYSVVSDWQATTCTATRCWRSTCMCLTSSTRL